MTITVKRLIAELEKIENKFLEVEVYGFGNNVYSKHAPIFSVKKADNNRKVLIIIENENGK